MQKKKKKKKSADWLYAEYLFSFISRPFVHIAPFLTLLTIYNILLPQVLRLRFHVDQSL